MGSLIICCDECQSCGEYLEMRVIKQLIHQINCPTLYGYTNPDKRIEAEKVCDDAWWVNRA